MFSSIALRVFKSNAGDAGTGGSDGAASGVGGMDPKEDGDRDRGVPVDLPDVVNSNTAAAATEEHDETFFQIGLQVLVPFLVAGMGMVGAGIYFSHMQKWPVFVNVSEVIILVPSLLGLKGNLEMTLASRLSTEANMGHMDDSTERYVMITRNLVLVQCQAIVVGLLSSIVAVLMVFALKQEFNLTHSLLMCACSLITASVASLVLGVVTAAVITFSRVLKINPDNVATPIAASLGDITSLVLLSWVASYIYEGIVVNDQISGEINGTIAVNNASVLQYAGKDGIWWVSPVVMVIYILSIPFWFWCIKNNRYTKTVLYSGWTPVIVAMIISTLGGLILDELVPIFSGLAVFQPVINGVGGNLVSVQASRLSTYLHKKVELGTLPPDTSVIVSPYRAFFKEGGFSVTARVLFSLVVPGHLVFIYSISFFDNVHLTALFVFSYLLVSLVQVVILLYLAYILTHYFWSRGIDPDNSTIPYLTAAGDLLGIVLLGLCFKCLRLLDDVTVG